MIITQGDYWISGSLLPQDLGFRFSDKKWDNNYILWGWGRTFTPPQMHIPSEMRVHTCNKLLTGVSELTCQWRNQLYCLSLTLLREGW